MGMPLLTALSLLANDACFLIDGLSSYRQDKDTRIMSRGLLVTILRVVDHTVLAYARINLPCAHTHIRGEGHA